MYNARYLMPQVSTVGLIAHYKLWAGPTTTGKIFDYSLNGHTGTLQGTSPTFKYPGIDLPGTDEYIQVSNPSHDFGKDTTILIWVKADSLTLNRQLFDTRDSLFASNSMAAWIDGTNSHLEFFAGGATDKFTFSSVTDTWYHIVIVYNGTLGSVTAYVNGISLTLDVSGPVSTSTYAGDNLTIGARADIASFFDGLFDDVMIFNKEFSAVEVKNIYEVSRWRYGV